MSGWTHALRRGSGLHPDRCMVEQGDELCNCDWPDDPTDPLERVCPSCGHETRPGRKCVPGAGRMSEMDSCPDCHHRWRAHQGRNGGERCWYNNLTRAGCPCRRKNPDIEAEERLAAAAWNAYMGRTPKERAG